MRYAVGIDLGTTHCVLASSPLGVDRVELLPIAQLVGPGEIAARPILPSFVYLAAGEGDGEDIVGTLALELGAKTPARLVSAAKSWICHGGVNRRAPILPWSAPDDAPHISPFEASVRYLAQLRAAWDAAHPEASLAAQDVVVTVPASFDEGARELTLDAARKAGLGEAHLLEEPQAAFYDFLRAGAPALSGKKLILVVDVGGGTTDLTLLAAADGGELERIAVGGHLLLGGENMDAALAHAALAKASISEALQPGEWAALMLSAREAKERLFAQDPPERATLSVQRRGSRLLGTTVSVSFERAEAERILLDGFMPKSGPADEAERRPRAGLTTHGLPYVTDPAIPRHVCTFLRRHAAVARAAGAAIQGGLPRPDALLLNGGVFKGPALVRRFSEVLAGWYGTPIALLEHTSLDTAVARGAARYALARAGLGRVIAGGLGRSYFIGVAAADGSMRALSIAPRGMEEGATLEIPERRFELVLGQRVSFPLYSSTHDRAAPAGELVLLDDELEPLPPLELALGSSRRDLRTGAHGGVPVTLSATLGEQGALEVYLTTVQLPPERWRLAFALAGASEPAPRAAPEPAAPASPALPPRIADAKKAVVRAFGRQSEPDQARALRGTLESLLGDRGSWSGATCRALADALLDAEAPHKSAGHELAWLRLTGFCLRPGFGFAGDDARMARLALRYERGLSHPSKGQWGEWWILWRRTAGGLSRADQMRIFAGLLRYFDTGTAARHGQAEMLPLLAALEHLPRTDKERAGEWLWKLAADGPFWPHGRLGARAPLYGAPEDTVRAEKAEAWVLLLLGRDWKQSEGAAFAAATIARMTGDPARDLPEALRLRVIYQLRASRAPSPWIDFVTKPHGLSESDASRLLGDTLPQGLRLAT